MPNPEGGKMKLWHMYWVTDQERGIGFGGTIAIVRAQTEEEARGEIGDMWAAGVEVTSEQALDIFRSIKRKIGELETVLNNIEVSI